MKVCKTCKKELPEWKEELYCNNICLDKMVKKFQQKTYLAKDNNKKCLVCGIEIQGKLLANRKYCGSQKEKTGCAVLIKRKQCVLAKKPYIRKNKRNEN